MPLTGGFESRRGIKRDRQRRAARVASIKNAASGISLAGLSFVLRWRKLNRSRSARPFFSGLLSRVSR
jgi:hypothetical protein